MAAMIEKMEAQNQQLVIPDSFQQLTDWIHQAGQYRYIFARPRNTALWLSVDKPFVFPGELADQNLYFGVNPTRAPRGEGKRARIADIAAVQCLVAEFDAGADKPYATKDDIRKHVEHLYSQGVPRAAYVIDSGGGLQLLWPLTQPVMIDDGNVAHVKDVQYKWVEFVGGDGGRKDLASVLRLPGSFNRKRKYEPNFPLVTVEHCDLSAINDFALFEELTADLRKEHQERRTHTPKAFTGGRTGGTPPHYLSDDDVWDVMEGDTYASDIFSLKSGNTAMYNGDMSRCAWHMVRHLYRYVGDDYARIGRMLSQTQIWYEKCERPDYIQRTVNGVIEKSNVTLFNWDMWERRKEKKEMQSGIDRVINQMKGAKQITNGTVQHTNGSGSQANGSAPQSTLEAVKGIIAQIAGNADLDNDEKQLEARAQLPDLIVQLSRNEQGQIEILLKRVGFTKTDAAKFIRECRQDAKRANQAEGDGAPTCIDLGNEYMAARIDHETGHTDLIFAREQWYEYNGNGLWEPVSEYAIEREFWEMQEENQDNGLKPSKSTLQSIDSFVKSNLYVDEELLDANEDYINLANGTYSLDGDVLLSHHPQRYFTSQLPFAYDRDAECPWWNQFVETTFVFPDGTPDPDLAAFMQEAFGYSLTTDVRFHKMFSPYGGGNNGKGVCMGILAQLGGNAAIPFNFDALSREQYQLADLPGKRIAICTESKTKAVVHDSTIKALVSGDPIRVRQINQRPFTLKPVAKLWWSFNRPPIVVDTSAGYWRRQYLIPFNADFEKRDADKRILDMEQRLKDELAGIFNWAMEGLRRLRANNAFTRVQQIEEVTERYRKDSNPVELFVEEECETGEGCNVLSSVIYSKYHNYCVAKGYKPLNSRNFKLELEQLGYFAKSRSVGTVYFGLRPKNDVNAV